MDFNPDNTLPENVIKGEKKWMPAADDRRNKTVYYILQSSKYDKMDPLIPYFAVNVFDRFITTHDLPSVAERVRDDMVLAAHSCLITAWKMRDHFSFSLFKKKRKLNMDFTKKLMKMEHKIQKGLNWREIKITTPTEFVDDWVRKTSLGQVIKRGTVDGIIIEILNDIMFTRFSPSVIAASAILAASRNQYPEQYEKNLEILLAEVEPHLNKSDVESCLKDTSDMLMRKKTMIERKEGFKDNPSLNLGAGYPSRRPGKDPMVESEVKEDEESILHKLQQKVADDLKYKPLAGYSSTVKAETNRRKALFLLKENYNRMNESKVIDPYVSFLTINLFDCYASRFPPESDDEISVIVMSCLCVIWDLTGNYSGHADFALNNRQLYNDSVKFESKIRDALSEITTPLPIKQIFDYLLSLVNESDTHKTCLKFASRGKMLYLMERDIKFTEFRPSTVAAAAVLTSILQVCPTNYPTFKNAVLTAPFIDEGELLQCLDELIVKNTVLTFMKLHTPQEEADQYSAITETVHAALRKQIEDNQNNN